MTLLLNGYCLCLVKWDWLVKQPPDATSALRSPSSQLSLGFSPLSSTRRTGRTFRRNYKPGDGIMTKWTTSRRHRGTLQHEGVLQSFCWKDLSCRDLSVVSLNQMRSKPYDFPRALLNIDLLLLTHSVKVSVIAFVLL